MGGHGHNRHGPKRGGLLCPFRGQLGPHLTQCGLGQGLPLYQILHLANRLATIDMGQNLGGVGVPFFLGLAGSPSNTKLPGTRPTSIPSGIQPFGHNGHWPKIGGCVPLGEGELGPHLVQCGLDQGPPPCQVPS